MAQPPAPLFRDPIYDGAYHMVVGYVSGVRHDWSGPRHILHYTSADLYHWQVRGPVISDRPHEGPNVFAWRGSIWMITDTWRGLGVYRSDDAEHWEQQDNILAAGGKRRDDGVMGNHADVLVAGDRAYSSISRTPAGPGSRARTAIPCRTTNAVHPCRLLNSKSAMANWCVTATSHLTLSLDPSNKRLHMQTGNCSPQSEAYILKLRESPAFGASGFDFAGLREGMAARREPVDTSVSCTRADIDGIPGAWVFAQGADLDIRMLYLHGGGFVSGSSEFYLALAGRISTAARCAVLLPDYRLAPENPFPDGLEDCIRAYGWLRAMGPHGPARARATFIAGDSAGGGLTLATLFALRDRGHQLPLAAIALSPFADLTLTGESIRSEGQLDPIMHPGCLPDFVKRYVADADVHHPLVSPVFGDYSGIPPLLIQAGEHEIIRDDSVRVAAKARADGAEVELEIWPGMFHVFQSHEPLLPEGVQAIEHIASFMRSCMAE
ncbi:MAG: alpha/beta hydrolase fold domain-containing protein [Chloroflexi bacterium]|nr:alpha/beta hydrolase fold domain-containing protein [Chloroflexota bacterium]